MKGSKGTALTMMYSSETDRVKFVVEIHISPMLYFSLCYSVSTQIYIHYVLLFMSIEESKHKF